MGVFFRYRGIEQNVNEKIDIFFYVKSSKYIHIIINRNIYMYICTLSSIIIIIYIQKIYINRKKSINI